MTSVTRGSTLDVMAVLFRTRLAGNMNPTGGTLALPNQLIDIRVVHQPFEPIAPLRHTVEVNVCRLTLQMLAVRLTLHLLAPVQRRTAVAAVDANGFPHVLPQRLQHFAAEGPERWDQFRWNPVVDL